MTTRAYRTLFCSIRKREQGVSDKSPRPTWSLTGIGACTWAGGGACAGLPPSSVELAFLFDFLHACCGGGGGSGALATTGASGSILCLLSV